MRLHYLAEDRSDAYLFVSTVIDIGILNEGASNRLSAAFDAAVNRLQNFMTPGASSDLDAMLGFFAPKGGGLAKVKELTAKAAELKSPLGQETGWWHELFRAFNVQDKSIQDSIIAKATEGQASPADSKPTPKPEPSKQRPAPQSDLHSQMAKNTADRQASLEKITALKAKIAAMKARGGPTVPTEEDVFNIFANGILNEQDVKSNLRFVANNLIRRLGYSSVTSSQESTWLDKFMRSVSKPIKEGGFSNFFDNLRTMVANPSYANNKDADSRLRHNNERMAKLAVKYLSDYLTQELKTRLKVANLTPKDMMQAYKEWQTVKDLYGKMKSENQSVPLQFINRVKMAHKQIQRVMYAIDPNLANGPTT